MEQLTGVRLLHKTIKFATQKVVRHNWDYINGHIISHIMNQTSEGQCVSQLRLWGNPTLTQFWGPM